MARSYYSWLGEKLRRNVAKQKSGEEKRKKGEKKVEIRKEVLTLGGKK